MEKKRKGEADSDLQVKPEMFKFKRVKSRFLTIFVYFKRKIAISNDFCVFCEVLLEIAISHETNAISREKFAASREKYSKIVINRDFSAFLNLNISCLTLNESKNARIIPGRLFDTSESLSPSDPKIATDGGVPAQKLSPHLLYV